MNIFLPNSAHLQNIDGFLRKYSPNDEKGLRLSSHPKYVHLHPAALAMTACAAATCRQRGEQIQSSIHNVSSLPYLVRMKLFDHLNIPPPRKITEHEEAGRFIPLTQIRNSDDLRRLITDIIPLLHATPAVADPIRYVLSELGRNVLEHANSTIGAYACAQYFRNSRKLAIGIADSGVGIFHSISRSHTPKNESDALALALTPGISGVTAKIGGNETNAGAGLYFIKCIAKMSENFFILYSGKCIYKLLKSQSDTLTLPGDPRMDAHRIIKDLPRWQGTVIGIDISIDTEVNFKQLLEQISKSYSLDIRLKKDDYYRRIRFT